MVLNFHSNLKLRVGGSLTGSFQTSVSHKNPNFVSFERKLNFERAKFIVAWKLLESFTVSLNEDYEIIPLMEILDELQRSKAACV